MKEKTLLSDMKSIYIPKTKLFNFDTDSPFC